MYRQDHQSEVYTGFFSSLPPNSSSGDDDFFFSRNFMNANALLPRVYSYATGISRARFNATSHAGIK